jgi:hypothetical protein
MFYGLCLLVPLSNYHYTRRGEPLRLPHFATLPDLPAGLGFILPCLIILPAPLWRQCGICKTHHFSSNEK